MLKQHFQTRQAVGSDVTLVLVSDMPEATASHLFDLLWGVVYRFERQFSRFIPESELSLFNRAGGSKRHISPEFRDILLAAKHMAEKTNGLYNPFILPALQRAGYTKSFLPGSHDDKQADYSHRSVVPIESLEIGDDWAKIPYNTSLDLGGCGKGYLADTLTAYLPSTVVGFWFSMGGDIVAGGHDELKHPWDVHIDDAFRTKNLNQFTFRATDFDTFAVATSGTTVRRGKSNGKGNWHHIIDPRTQKPSDSDVQLASVYCASGVNADVLASCAVILGSKEAVSFLKSHEVDAALLLTKGGDTIQFGSKLIQNKSLEVSAHA